MVDNQQQPSPGTERLTRYRAFRIAPLLILFAGCALAADLGSAAGPIPAADVAAPVGFPECQAESFDFAGEGTLRGLGLDTATPVPPPDPDRVGMIWVTHDLMPHDSGPPGGSVEMVRMLCFEFPDGSGGSGWPVDSEWQEPRVASAAEGETTSDAFTMPALLVAGGVLLLAVAVSVAAFRRPR